MAVPYLKMIRAFTVIPIRVGQSYMLMKQQRNDQKRIITSSWAQIQLVYKAVKPWCLLMSLPVEWILVCMQDNAKISSTPGTLCSSHPQMDVDHRFRLRIKKLKMIGLKLGVRRLMFDCGLMRLWIITFNSKKLQT